MQMKNGQSLVGVDLQRRSKLVRQALINDWYYEAWESILRLAATYTVIDKGVTWRLMCKTATFMKFRMVTNGLRCN
jgi:hypothetical protein